MKKLLIICLLSITTNCFANTPNYIVCPQKIECFGTAESCIVKSNDDKGYFTVIPKPSIAMPVSGVYELDVAINDMITWSGICVYRQPSHIGYDSEVQYQSNVTLDGKYSFLQKPYLPNTSAMCQPKMKGDYCLFVRCNRSGGTCNDI